MSFGIAYSVMKRFHGDMENDCEFMRTGNTSYLKKKEQKKLR